LRNQPPEGDTRQWERGMGVAEVKVDYSPDFIEERALEFIEDNQKNPFFLYYCPTLPHANNEGGDTPDGMEVDTYAEFEDKDWKPNEKGFARMVQRIDETVGKVVNKVKELGLEEDTLILFSSDNGPHNEGGHSVKRFDSAGGFQGYKRSLHEGGIRIPFIARWKGKIEGGQTSDYMGYFPDFLATFSEMAGIELNTEHDGISLLPLLTDNPTEQEEHPYLYFEFEGQVAVKKDEWKYFKSSNGSEALYNLVEDRHEDNNIKDVYPKKFAELKNYAQLEHQDYQPATLPGE
jgi:arylsulfatase A-like enzyme